MGDPRKPRKKYSTPSHPWQRDRIEKEKELKKQFGLKNKKEIWIASSHLRKLTTQAKNLIREKTEKQEKQFLESLYRFNLMKQGAKIEEVLDLITEDILARRLQTLVFKRGLARSPKQARQFITHGHISIKDKKINKPSYFVSKEEESLISYNPTSSISKIDHPERIKEEEKKEIIKNKEEIQKKEKLKKEVKKEAFLKKRNQKKKR